MDGTQIAAFRQEIFGTFTREADALQEILDALLTESQAQSFIELSLAPACQRRWPSCYKALARGRIDVPKLRRLLTAQVTVPPEGRLLLAVDSSPIVRAWSPTAADRTLNHTTTLGRGATPAQPGWQYSLVAQVPPTPSSAILPLAIDRITSTTTPAVVAIRQLKALTMSLPGRPLVLGDRYYGSDAFLL